MTTKNGTAPARTTRRRFLTNAFASALTGAVAASYFDAGALFGEEIPPGVVEPTAEEISAAIAAMNATTAENPTSARLDACDVLQRSVDRLRAKEFKEYFDADPERAAKWERERGILRYLNESFDKVLRELRETRAEDGSVVFWHLYNMGYLVKTPTQTFAIDVRHRRAPELVPYVDFLHVTHNHGDHYSRQFCNALADAGKPVVSNFIENDWFTPENEAQRSFGDVAVKMKRVDHNKTNLINYVTTFEIACGARAGDCVLYHVGDACDFAQLNPSARVDVFIPHLAVGLDVPKCVNETIKPGRTFLSHILELGHLIDKWRWSYRYGYGIVAKCANDSVALPVWGEKIVWKRG